MLFCELVVSSVNRTPFFNISDCCYLLAEAVESSRIIKLFLAIKCDFLQKDVWSLGLIPQMVTYWGLTPARNNLGMKLLRETVLIATLVSEGDPSNQVAVTFGDLAAWLKGLLVSSLTDKICSFFSTVSKSTCTLLFFFYVISAQRSRLPRGPLTRRFCDKLRSRRVSGGCIRNHPEWNPSHEDGALRQNAVVTYSHVIQDNVVEKWVERLRQKSNAYTTLLCAFSE